jgi:hypothetical protein
VKDAPSLGLESKKKAIKASKQSYPDINMTYAKQAQANRLPQRHVPLQACTVAAS